MSVEHGSSADDRSGPLVVLIGPPGSGKTTVGQALASHWRVRFRDTDDDVERTDGRTVADIFVESGEPLFRELEVKAVTAALREHEGVLALGGGAVLSDGVRQLLRNQRVTFLDVGLASAMERLEMNRSRPLLLGNVRAQWQDLAKARRPLYLEVADLTVPTDNRSVADIVIAIANQFPLTREPS